MSFKPNQNILEELTITIFQDSEGEYQYDIYDSTDLESIGNGDLESRDGGVCTGTMAEALEMAQSQAKHLLNLKEIKTV